MGVGRKPTPRAINLVMGNPSGRPLRTDEAQPPVGAEPPEGMSEAGLAQWRKNAPLLIKCGLLTEVDAIAFAMLCESIASLGENTAKFKRTPLQRTRTGYVCTTPFYAMKNHDADRVHKLLVEFGMTPSSRTRVSAAQVEVESAEPPKHGLASFRRRA